MRTPNAGPFPQRGLLDEIEAFLSKANSFGNKSLRETYHHTICLSKPNLGTISKARERGREGWGGGGVCLVCVCTYIHIFLHIYCIHSSYIQVFIFFLLINTHTGIHTYKKLYLVQDINLMEL